MNFPIIADPERKSPTVRHDFHPTPTTSHGAFGFRIGPDKKIKLTITYPASTVAIYRNFARD